MPDEATQAPEEIQDTPDPAASDQEIPASESTDSPPAASDPYEPRYNNLRSEFDRRNAALSGQLGPQAQAEALSHYGIELAEAEQEAEDDLFDDPVERTQREVEELKQWRAEREQREQNAEFEKLEREYIDSTLKEIEKTDKEGFKLSEKDKRIVEAYAKGNRLDDGRPDLEGGFALVKESKAEAREGYLKSKRDATAAPVGAEGEAKVDFSKMTPEQKDQWMVEDVERRQAMGES